MNSTYNSSLLSSEHLTFSLYAVEPVCPCIFAPSSTMVTLVRALC